MIVGLCQCGSGFIGGLLQAKHSRPVTQLQSWQWHSSVSCRVCDSAWLSHWCLTFLCTGLLYQYFLSL